MSTETSEIATWDVPQFHARSRKVFLLRVYGQCFRSASRGANQWWSSGNW